MYILIWKCFRFSSNVLKITKMLTKFPAVIKQNSELIRLKLTHTIYLHVKHHIYTLYSKYVENFDEVKTKILVGIS
jgi:hypothetical protein